MEHWLERGTYRDGAIPGIKAAFIPSGVNNSHGGKSTTLSRSWYNFPLAVKSKDRDLRPGTLTRERVHEGVGNTRCGKSVRFAADCAELERAAGKGNRVIVPAEPERATS